MKFCHSPDTGNIAACEFSVNIFEIILQFLFGLALGHVIWKFLKVSQPHLIFLPVNVFQDFHNFIMHFNRSYFNKCKGKKAAAIQPSLWGCFMGGVESGVFSTSRHASPISRNRRAGFFSRQLRNRGRGQPEFHAAGLGAGP
jgi:hypothetical protein